jgi:predicted ATP-dependent endonuclease of OLD family
MATHLSGIKATLSKKAAGILGEQKEIAQRILNAKSIELSTNDINLDHIYESLTLQVKNGVKSSMPMENVGTGHQSAVIINLYKQFGQSLDGKTLYLFEEPDAHLHPPTVREIGSQLTEISDRSQVLITTHSPILISHIGLEKVLHLKHKQNEGTTVHPANINMESQSSIGHKLLKYGLRITEALFTKLVVLVEGPSDAIVVGRLIERKSGKNCDQLDILIVPAGGKDNIVEIAEILNMLNVSWKAIFDYDAALTTSAIPITDGSYDDDDNTENVDSINSLIQCLNINKKRGRKAFTQLNNLKIELENGIPKKEYYNDSTLEKLLTNIYAIPATKAATLKTAIKNERVQVIRKILSSYGVWLMRPDLERTITGKNFSNSVAVDKIIRAHADFNVSKEDGNHQKSMINNLHCLSNRPEVLVRLTDSILDDGGFARTDLNMAVTNICDFIE